MANVQVYLGGSVFDGYKVHDGLGARFVDGRFDTFCPPEDLTGGPHVTDLKGDLLSPGFVDLQVNGGDGLMLNDDPSIATLARMAQAHRRLGTVQFLPTLITDTVEKTQATIAAVRAALDSGIPGIAGLHLEGPHLSVARKGAHDAALIRPMAESDLETLLAAKSGLPVLKVTLAPESVTREHVATLADAGVVISLGHTDADYETCMAYVQAGAGCATHLFNAMSQFGNRQPGLVGAVLDSGDLSCGLIADGLHVHPAVMRAAWRGKQGPGRLFLVSDAMAVAGTDQSEFMLEGRRILRRDKKLTLEDGTLAGADLDMASAVRTLVEQVGLTRDDALQAATTTPAKLIGLPTGLTPGTTPLSDMIRISPDLSVAAPITG
ncbi:MAG: N-acetylglucosamine-6-phosphate deacetylase [Pseudomonadota bacterium]